VFVSGNLEGFDELETLLLSANFLIRTESEGSSRSRIAYASARNSGMS
jgi:hypothetical protein